MFIAAQPNRAAASGERLWPAGEDSSLAHALEAGRQQVVREVSDERVGSHANRAFAVGFVDAPPKAHPNRIAAEEAVVRERDALVELLTIGYRDEQPGLWHGGTEELV